MKVLAVKDYLDSIIDDKVKTDRAKMYLYILARTNLFANNFKLDIYDMSVICQLPEDDVVNYVKELESTNLFYKLRYNSNNAVCQFKPRMYVTANEFKEDESYLSFSEIIPFSVYAVGKYYPISRIVE